MPTGTLPLLDDWAIFSTPMHLHANVVHHSMMLQGFAEAFVCTEHACDSPQELVRWKQKVTESDRK
jgi:hypothetical protein